MPQPIALKQYPPPAWPRLVFGGSVALLAAAALVWTLLHLSVEYIFRTTPAPSNGEDRRLQQIEYSEKMRTLLTMDPVNGDVRNSLVNALSMRNEYRRAVDNLQIVRRISNSQESLFFLAVTCEKMGDLKTAEALMADCTRINPTNYTYHEAWLRLLNMRLAQLNSQKKDGKAADADEHEAVRLAFGRAAVDWAIRAPNDHNSHIFLGQYYIEPLYALQAYRCYLFGLSGAQGLNLTRESMIEKKAALETIRQIIQGGYAKRYRNLP